MIQLLELGCHPEKLNKIAWLVQHHIIIYFVKLYKHQNYEHYVRCQIEETSFKHDRVWAEEEEVIFLAKHLENPKFGICHGVRTGQEVLWFREHTNAEVIGTEISPLAATQCEHTIAWDFHNAKPEWIGIADFIYSNSLDHSYDPERCLRSWVRCLKLRGTAFVQWSEAVDQAVDDADCASFSFDDMKQLCQPYLKNILHKRLRLDYHWFALSPQVSLF